MCVLILSISFVQQAYWLYTSSSSLYDWICYCPVQYVPYEVKVDIVELCVFQPWPWLLKILVCSITLEEVGLIRCLSNVSFCLYIHIKMMICALIIWSVLITGTCIASNWLQKCYYIQLIIYTLQSYIYILYMSEFRAI